MPLINTSNKPNHCIARKNIPHHAANRLLLKAYPSPAHELFISRAFANPHLQLNATVLRNTTLFVQSLTWFSRTRSRLRACNTRYSTISTQTLHFLTEICQIIQPKCVKSSICKPGSVVTRLEQR